MICPEGQLRKLGIGECGVSMMREKDGIALFRVEAGCGRYVLKVFEREEDRREIRNYQILQDLGVPVLPVVGCTDQAILLPDIDASPVYRLGREEDLSDIHVAARLAQWYRVLHSKGAEFVRDAGDALYDENDDITVENMRFLKARSQTGENPFWALLFENFAAFRRMIDGMPRTLTYNDFYYTNFVVARDGSHAMMFDFNLLGKGCVWGDIRNVCSSLSEKAGEAFIEAYGEVDEAGRCVDEIAAELFTLLCAYRREKLPEWVGGSTERLRDGTLYAQLSALLHPQRVGKAPA